MPPTDCDLLILSLLLVSAKECVGMRGKIIQDMETKLAITVLLILKMVLIRKRRRDLHICINKDFKIVNQCGRAVSKKKGEGVLLSLCLKPICRLAH